MTADEYLAVMRRALAESVGVKIAFATRADAYRVARKIYKLRDRRRELGQTEFDILSMSRTTPLELHIYRRDRLAVPARDDGLKPQQGPLAQDELPTRPARILGALNAAGTPSPALWIAIPRNYPTFRALPLPPA